MKSVVTAMCYFRFVLTLVLAFSVSGAWADGVPFKNPWIVKKEVVSAEAEKTFQCALPPALSADMTLKIGPYSDAKGSIRDEAKAKQMTKVTDAVNKADAALVRMISDYQRTGNEAEGACALQWLKSFANDGVLTGKVDGFQARFNQAWKLSSFSLVWLKLQASENVSANDRKHINQWLDKMAGQTKAYFSKSRKSSDGIGNMYYWAGLGIMATGISLNRQDYFDWGVERYKRGLDQVTEDGFLPRELERGQRARAYHLFALQPLTTMAELAAVNGVNLYSYNNNALLRLTTATIESLHNPQKIENFAGVIQMNVESDALSMGWLQSISQRFPSPLFDDALKKYRKRSDARLGGESMPCCVVLSDN